MDKDWLVGLNPTVLVEDSECFLFGGWNGGFWWLEWGFQCGWNGDSGCLECGRNGGTLEVDISLA